MGLEAFKRRSAIIVQGSSDAVLSVGKLDNGIGVTADHQPGRTVGFELLWRLTRVPS